MPILSAFIVGLMFNDVDSKAAIAAVVFGVIMYGIFSFVWSPIHYIHLMFITLISCVVVAVTISKFVFGTNPIFRLGKNDATALRFYPCRANNLLYLLGAQLDRAFSFVGSHRCCGHSLSIINKTLLLICQESPGQTKHAAKYW